jgi:hypothetical protein
MKPQKGSIPSGAFLSFQQHFLLTPVFSRRKMGICNAVNGRLIAGRSGRKRNVRVKELV